MTSVSLIRDLTDDEARAALVLKWGETEPGVIPAWVAEMDYAVAEPITAAVLAAVERGEVGYPAFQRSGGRLGEAYAGFAHRRLGWSVPAERVLPTADVTVGVRIALEVLSEPGPMVLPVPSYDPQHGLAQITDREQWDLPVDPDGDDYVGRPGRAGPAVRARRPDAAAHPAAQPVRPRAHPGRARGHPRRRGPARRPGGERRDPRAAGAPRRRARPLPLPRGHRRPRGLGRGGVQGVQHPRG